MWNCDYKVLNEMLSLKCKKIKRKISTLFTFFSPETILFFFFFFISVRRTKFWKRRLFLYIILDFVFKKKQFLKTLLFLSGNSMHVDVMCSYNRMSFVIHWNRMSLELKLGKEFGQHGLKKRVLYTKRTAPPIAKENAHRDRIDYFILFFFLCHLIHAVSGSVQTGTFFFTHFRKVK